MTKKTAQKADTYGLQGITTPERLEMRFAYGNGKTINFGDFTLIAGYYYKPNSGCYFGAVYRFSTDNHTCEGKVELISISDDTFEDDGHAIAWAISKVN